MRQSFQQWEWLIVNDGSTQPQALAILDEYRHAAMIPVFGLLTCRRIKARVPLETGPFEKRARRMLSNLIAIICLSRQP